MKMDDMFPSNFLKAGDCDEGDLILTIKGVEEEKIGQDTKWVLHFRGEKKGLVLNKTNAATLVKLYGDDTDDWAGKQITLFATEVQYQSEMVAAIRIRSKPPRAPKPAPATQTTEIDQSDDAPF